MRKQNFHVIAVCCAVVLFLPLQLLAQTLNLRDRELERKALLYKKQLVGYSVAFLGYDAPIPLFAAQVEQESHWNPLAKSPYACGLTQFTPDTEKWINTLYPKELQKGNCYSPDWSLKAQVLYSKWLNIRVEGNTSCDKEKFKLWAYNGGLGWVYRDQKKAEKELKDKKNAEEVREVNAGRSKEFFKENRDYDIKILQKHQKKYKDWGGILTCIP